MRTTTAALVLAVLLAGCSGPEGAPAPSSPPSSRPASPSAAGDSSSAPSPGSSAPLSSSPGASSPATTAPSAATSSRPSGSPTPAPSSSAAKQSEPSGPSEPSRTARDVDSADSPTVVVNKARPLDPVDYAPGSLESVDGVPLRPEAAAALEALRAEAAAAGHHLTVLSGYRSYGRQQQVYAGWVSHHGSAEAADRISARPGHSEHQTGLAVDLGDAASPDCDLDACFGTTPAGRWVAAHAHEHGFVVRFPEGAEQVTGFSAEPWHLRWLGAEAAAQVHAGGGVVETVFGLPDAPGYRG
ncbi:M15 family metallopeptidase [Micrococcus sp. FDAARGOS_333]|uniref:M15 family metallopeptidase n=1 Tax=Micrococcus sp. FDAARGOS_333 TaxID=1930558 RepID=UPI000B4E7296|nr:M15 family metallopeptidase [Micrococcus sp. FDAARGOS_333]PNL19089.1 D-alanyl-D-alanine carboxypeptidase [Micrococcus sp. FDAARGOS_333]